MRTQTAARRLTLLLLSILVIQALASGAPSTRAQAVTTYSLLSYQMQVSMSFDNIYLSGVTEDTRTLQFTLNIVLSPSSFELHGLKEGTGTYSATYYSNKVLS